MPYFGGHRLSRSKRVPRPTQSGRFTGGGKYFVLIFLMIVAVMVAWVYLSIA